MSMEARKEKPPDIGVKLHSHTRVTSNEPNDVIQVIEEITTQTLLSFFVPLDRIVNFPIS